MPSPTKTEIISKMSVADARAALEAALKREQVEIRKRNKEFHGLPDWKKRVTIAQDVLQQLEAKRFIAKFGAYLIVDSNTERAFDSYDERYDSEKGLQEALAGAQCQVCGIGSLFVAAVDRANACTVGDIGDDTNDDDYMRKYLGDWFEDDQLVMIEAAFEGRWISSDETTSSLWSDSDEVLDSIRFTRRVTTPEGRLKKIMQNIVDNKGTFKP